MVDHVIMERDILANTQNPFVVELFYAFDSDVSILILYSYLCLKI